jgi:mannose-6-phosphate isomerase-like protein (cupin superfamily)
MRFSLTEALDRIPGPDGRRFATVFERGTLALEVYAPRGHDPQQPHARDEVYVVVRGHGTFARAGQRTPFAAGDCLFAPAGEEHRFEGFSDDLVVWVVFYGPPGGEGASLRAGAGTAVP